MIKPRYQDYQADQIPAVSADGAAVRVMAGHARGAAGPLALRNPGLLLDVALEPGASFTQPARAALADSAACGGCAHGRAIATLGSRSPRVHCLAARLRFMQRVHALPCCPVTLCLGVCEPQPARVAQSFL
jgi:hypothetical protein